MSTAWYIVLWYNLQLEKCDPHHRFWWKRQKSGIDKLSHKPPWNPEQMSVTVPLHRSKIQKRGLLLVNLSLYDLSPVTSPPFKLDFIIISYCNSWYVGMTNLGSMSFVITVWGTGERYPNELCGRTVCNGYAIVQSVFVLPSRYKIFLHSTVHHATYHWNFHCSHFPKGYRVIWARF